MKKLLVAVAASALLASLLVQPLYAQTEEQREASAKRFMQMYFADFKARDWVAAKGHILQASSYAQEPLLADVCNNAAFLLACAPDGQVRDGARAVEFAQRSVEMNLRLGRAYEHAMALGNLAAAYAEVGDFPNAITAVEQAIASLAYTIPDPAKRERQLAVSREALGLYKNGQPYRIK